MATGAKQMMGYPAYLVEMAMSNGNTIAIWLASYGAPYTAVNGIYSTPSAPSMTDQAITEVSFPWLDGSSTGPTITALIEAVTTWATTYTWPDGITITDVTVTLYDETSQNVTPAS